LFYVAFLLTLSKFLSMNPFLKQVMAATLGGVITLAAYKLLIEPTTTTTPDTPPKSPKISQYLESIKSSFKVPDGLNFVVAAERVTPAVVHIKTYNELGAVSNTVMNWLKPNDGGVYEEAPSSSGSGVIISEDGYIVTNNHVIEDAERLEVVLDDKRSFEAKVIGIDAATDLALLQIKNNELLPYVTFGNSDEVHIGEWVLAVGNPFDLTSTVTAGIVSAKSRNIHILRSKDNLAVEAFIQTDAAVNPGNSGGALVNLKGELIGINTAIATHTGSYSGYSFAVPVSLVKKVTEDLKKYGEVQRALLGVTIQDVTAELAKQHGLRKVHGVYVTNLQKGGGGDEAGIEIGDVIVEIEGASINSVAALQEAVARHRPGDKVKVKFEREGNLKELTVVLKNRDNTTTIVKTQYKATLVEDIGAELIELTDKEKSELKINYGVKVVRVLQGKFKDAKVQAGTIILQIDKVKIKSVAQLQTVVQNVAGGVLVEAIEPPNRRVFFALGM
jgi:serine protease Do